MPSKIKISIIIGTRPELIKISSLLRRLSLSNDFEFQFIDTGQHYDYEMDKIFCEELKLPQPIFLDLGSSTPAHQVGRAMILVEKQLQHFNPDVALVVGDTNSTLSGTLTAIKMNIPVAHLEAGLRSFDRTMPEEMNRIVVDHVSHWLFAPTQQAIDNLVAEGIERNKITFTYDIHVDVLNDHFSLAKENSKILSELNLKKFVLITCHRQSNTDSSENLANIVDALIELANNFTVVFPVHPRTDKKLREFGLYEKLASTSNIKLIKPVGFFDFLNLMGHAACVITDSGGVQKETLILKIPCVTIRENTEWIETIAAGANVLAGTDKSKIVAEVSRMAQPDFHEFMQTVINPYGNGETSQIILNQLASDLRQK